MSEPLETVEEEKLSLQFDDYALAFHFAAQWDDPFPAEWKASRRDGPTAAEPMESYERDILLYAHRDEPPFHTLVVPRTATLAVRFPPELVYESELRRVRLRCAAAGPTGRIRRFTLLASVTIFERSRVVVGNLALAPVPAAPHESGLNEYDLIKLIKLWEGGEGRAVPHWENEILFQVDDGEPMTLTETATHLFEEWLPRHDAQVDDGDEARPGPVEPARVLAYRVGTVELAVPATGRTELFSDLAALKDGEAPDPKAQRARWDRVVAVGGILQGLLDFRVISRDELADVFGEAEVDADAASLTGFHKGTLLALSAESEPESSPHGERRSPIGVDPYLAIPNIVLLHNEQQLKASRQLELRLSRGQPGRSASRSDRADINQTANGLDVITGLLAQHLPNIFHYPAERRLYETGGHSRGFDDLETLIQLRREELASTLQRRERRRDRWTAVLAVVSAIVVGVVAAVQNLVVQEVIETLDWWLILIVAGLLYLAFFQIRNRLF